MEKYCNKVLEVEATDVYFLVLITIYATRKSSGLDEAVGVLKVGKHHLEMSAFRFERLPYRRQVEHTI